MDIQILRAVVHYTLHFVAPLLLALLFFPDGKRRKACWPRPSSPPTA